jgi:hypothetical protein
MDDKKLEEEPKRLKEQWAKKVQRYGIIRQHANKMYEMAAEDEARMYRVLYDNLLKQGFTKEEAMILTREAIRGGAAVAGHGGSVNYESGDLQPPTEVGEGGHCAGKAAAGLHVLLERFLSREAGPVEGRRVDHHQEHAPPPVPDSHEATGAHRGTPAKGLARLRGRVPERLAGGQRWDHGHATMRGEILSKIWAQHHFLSAEPWVEAETVNGGEEGALNTGDVAYMLKDFDWVILGGQSGPGARPMSTEWARAMRDACLSSRIPFFLKQNGGYPDAQAHEKALLDGRLWKEMPEVEA